MSDPRYPTGPFTPDPSPTAKTRVRHIDQLASVPVALRKAVSGLNKEQINTPYRDGGWTVKQLVHHVPDSHLNAYIRFKLALTEDTPTIKPYDQTRWAELADSREAPVETSLQLLESLRDRWVRLLRPMSAADLSRNLMHPESGTMSLDSVPALYGW